MPIQGFTSQGIILLDHNRETNILRLQRISRTRPPLPASSSCAQLRRGLSRLQRRRSLRPRQSHGVACTASSVTRITACSSKRPIRISAGFAAAEASMDFDWIRPRLSVAYASGDNNPYDNKSHRFRFRIRESDFRRRRYELLDQPGHSADRRRRRRACTAAMALIPDLRSSKEQGQSNFDNPGFAPGRHRQRISTSAADAAVRERQRTVVRQHGSAGSVARSVADRPQHRHRCIARMDLPAAVSRRTSCSACPARYCCPAPVSRISMAPIIRSITRCWLMSC